MKVEGQVIDVTAGTLAPTPHSGHGQQHTPLVGEPASGPSARRRPVDQLRQRLFADDRRLTLHPGGCLNLGASGVHVHYERFQFTTGVQEYTQVGRRVTVLYDAETAELAAIILGNIPLFDFDGDDAFATETSITSGVGTRLLARVDVESAALYGTGRQARRHLKVLCTIRPRLRTVRVYSPNSEHVREFCRLMEPHIAPTQLVEAANPEEAARGADVIVTATNSNVPVLFGEWLAPGTHVTSIVGSNKELVPEGSVAHKRRELDDDVLAHASAVVATHRDQAVQDEQGDLFDVVQRGLLSWDGIASLAEVVAGTAPRRSSEREITVFKQNGDQGATYLALARVCYERAKQLGRGIEIDDSAAEQ